MSTLPGLFFTVLVGLPSVAQEPAVDGAELEALLQAVNKSSVEGAEELRELYRSAIDFARRAETARARTEAYRRDIEAAPGLLSSLQSELEKPSPPPRTDEEPDLDLRELEAGLRQAEAEQSVARSHLAELLQEEDTRERRLSALPEEISKARLAQNALEEALQNLPEGVDHRARHLHATAELEAAQSELARLEAERTFYEAEREVLELRTDRARRQLSAADLAVERWQSRTATQRELEAEEAAREAERQKEEITHRFPSLENLALRNEELARMRSGATGLPARIVAAREELSLAEKQLGAIEDRFAATRRKVEVMGLTESMGLLLRSDFEWLPSLSGLDAEDSSRRRRLSVAQIQQIDIEEERARTSDLSAGRALERLGITTSTDPIRQVAGELVAAQEELHDAVLDDLQTLIDVLLDLEITQSQLVSLTGDYRNYIERRILWVRSSPANPLGSFLAAPRHLGELALAMAELVRESRRPSDTFRPGRALPLLGLCLVLLLARRPLKRRQRDLAERVRSFRSDRFRYTLMALVIASLLALPWALLFYVGGWPGRESPEELVRVAAHSLRELAGVVFVLELLRQVSARGGLGELHFHWPSSSMAGLRRELLWFTPLVLPLGFIALTLDRHSTGEWCDSLGRLAVLSAMVALAVFLFRLVRPGAALWSRAFMQGKGLLGRTHRLWATVAILFPLVLAIIALAGYYYTALQFELRLRQSMGFALGLVFVHALLLRWLFVTRRRLAVAQAREKIRARSETAASEPPQLEEDKIDIPSVDAQTRQLFQSGITLAAIIGLYFIWVSTLPALGGLDSITLWPEFAILESTDELTSAPRAPNIATTASTDGNGPGMRLDSLRGTTFPGETTASPAAELFADSVTLGDLVLALIFLFLTWVAARNIPGLLEISLLQRLPLDGGARYAIATIVRYVIVIIGISTITGALGLGWDKIQWLAAALTFGLAFGLQEIFANFVSGVIILIERPIRVGDIVTVAGTEGRVTRLRMRATTIQDYERREYLIPNKEFITGSVINWTLSDPVTRIVLPVGIAYGSDTKRARSLLLQAAREEPLVLPDPVPSACFLAFGESSLDFELRVFIANREQWPEVTDMLHARVDGLFRESRIEIAFPQHDLHIRSTVRPPGDGNTGEVEAAPDKGSP